MTAVRTPRRTVAVSMPLRTRFGRRFRLVLLAFVAILPVLQFCVSLVHVYRSSQSPWKFVSQSFNFHDVIAAFYRKTYEQHNRSEALLTRNLEWILSRAYDLVDSNTTDLDFDAVAVKRGDVLCFERGTLSSPEIDGGVSSNTVATATTCRCKPDWHGKFCSIPGIVYRSQTTWSKDDLQLRSRRRRTVVAFPFNIEFDMLELRFAELTPVVDVFLILESNFTAYGRRKPLHLLERLRNGTYGDELGQKIVYVYLDFFPEDAYKDGWVADALHRNYLGTSGLKRIKGLQMDDLFVLNDADELPSREAIEFLQWHDGYSEPVVIRYQRTSYGFFWGTVGSDGKFRFHELPSVVSIGMLIHVFKYQAYSIRNAVYFLTQHVQEIEVYRNISSNRRVECWTLGNGRDDDIAGWHCSWCLTAEGIRIKLISAQNGDFPRWGDYPEKTEISYIKRLVAQGRWFDDISTMKRITNIRGPKSLLDQPIRYRHLLVNVYEQEQLHHQQLLLQQQQQLRQQLTTSNVASYPLPNNIAAVRAVNR